MSKGAGRAKIGNTETFWLFLHYLLEELMGLWVPVCALGLLMELQHVPGFTSLVPCSPALWKTSLIRVCSQHSVLCCAVWGFSSPVWCPELSLVFVNSSISQFPFPAADLVLGVLLVQGVTLDMSNQFNLLPNYISLILLQIQTQVPSSG